MVARRCLILGCAALSLAACQPKTAGVTTPADPAREADAIRGGEADRAVEMNERDLDKAAAHYASGAVVAWPGMAPVRGAARIRSALAESFKDPGFTVDWKAERITVAQDGDMAWASGRYSLTRTDPATKKTATVQGPFVETFAKSSDGRWVITSALSGGPPAEPVED